ncbi:MAG: AmmeMemoRadiSam system protein B [Spirochaetes bacterium]|nr:AmmeMemoRadiSam system protein B [Spirochaetota bacterium]
MAMRRLLVAAISVAVLLGCRGKEKPVSASVSPDLRPPAVAGSFYPADPVQLRTAVDGFLSRARRSGVAIPDGEEPVAILVPHAGYDFSGPCAAFAYAALDGRQFDRIVLLGPPHTVAVQGAAVYCGAGFQTPLGAVPVDTALARAIVGSSSVIHDSPAPHTAEHSLEVQLPFLLETLKKVSIVPILVMGDSAILDSVARSIIDAVRSSNGGFSRTLFVISTDLAHYPSEADATASDREILSAFCSLDPGKLVAADRAIMARKLPKLSCTMCGLDAAYVGLQIARAAGATMAHLLDTRTSADAGISGAGADSVVGYGAVLVSRPAVKASRIPLKEPLTTDEQGFLLRSARTSIEEYLKTGKRSASTAPAGNAHLGERRGCFVTLYERSEAGLQLHGCIGMHESALPLVQLVPEMALASAFEDPRFPPLTAGELRTLTIEISVYRTGVVPIASPDEFVVGEQGIILRVGAAEATFLPQVATEQGWDRRATFENLCHKAGLDRDAWKSRDAHFSVYVTQAFRE